MFESRWASEPTPGWPPSCRVDLRFSQTGTLAASRSIPGLGRSREEGNGNLLQYPGLENAMDRGAWWATIHGVTESDTTEHIRMRTHTGAAASRTDGGPGPRDSHGVGRGYKHTHAYRNHNFNTLT